MTIFTVAFVLVMLPAPPAQQRLASTAVRSYGDEHAESRAVFSSPVSLPSNVSVPGAYDDLVDTMLRSSPTFRAQCSRIATTPGLHVSVQRSLNPAPQAALTHLIRQSDGRLEADVEIGLFGDVTMLLAHEFEHIIEQLDGVNLVALADRAGTGVRTNPRNGQFETERAIEMGQRVAREVTRAAARR